MNKEFYDRHGKELECAYCGMLNDCIKSKQPLRFGCERLYYKDRCEVLEKALELLIIDLGAYGDDYPLEQSIEDTIQQAEKELKGENDE